jgi:uncharacterized membrane protein
MRTFGGVLVAGLLSAAVASTVSLAPVASADCTSSGGTTLCSQGDSRGANDGRGPGTTGTYMPYGCGGANDWVCNSYDGWGVDIDLDPGWGNRPGPGRGGGRR